MAALRATTPTSTVVVMFLEMQKLWSTDTAVTIRQARSGVYRSVPPELSKHRKRDFMTPKQRSITFRVRAWAALYATSDGVDGEETGVSSHGSAG